MKKNNSFFLFKFYILLLSMLVFLPDFIFSQSERYIEIPELNSRNVVFKQYQQDVLEANKAYFKGEQYPVSFYSYICNKEDSFISISARCCIRQETLASVNGIEDTQTSLENKKIILPVKDGLFIAENPVSTLEMILCNDFKDKLSSAQKFTVSGRTFYFIPDAKFTPSQRAFFLTPGFISPLEQKVITSAFGNRISPISGKWKNHNGIDLAASFGSNVFACRSGKVQKILKNDPVYGNCIILAHSNGFTSMYAHLSQILVQENQTLAAGHLIGKVGLTGLTTGPHLHFEIHQYGIAENPENYL